MKKFCFVLLVSVFMFPAFTSAADWGYGNGPQGPDNWHNISPLYKMCKSGMNQAPIDLRPSYGVNLPPLQISYNKPASAVYNKGYTIEAEFPKGNYITIGKQRYHLQQVHLHGPSENLIKGKRYPMEAHFVHENKKGEYAILAVMFEIGHENSALTSFISFTPKLAGQNTSLPANLLPKDLLPGKQDYYYFNGSLTTPPCSESVRWYVLKNSVSLSKKQLLEFHKLLSYPKNNRPAQSINARVILE